MKHSLLVLNWTIKSAQYKGNLLLSVLAQVQRSALALIDSDNQHGSNDRPVDELLTTE